MRFHEIILLLSTFFLSFNTWAAPEKTYYCGGRYYGCEDYTFDIATLRFEKDKTTLIREFKEGDIPWKLTFTAPAVKVSENLNISFKYKSGGIADKTYKDGMIAITLKCDSKKSCSIQSTGYVTDLLDKTGKVARAGKQDAHLTKFQLFCNEEKVAVDEAASCPSGRNL